MLFQPIMTLRKKEIEARAHERHQREMAEYQEKI